MVYNGAKEVQPVTLKGKTVVVRPLVETDIEKLYVYFSQTDEHGWYYMKDEYPANAAAFRKTILPKTLFRQPYFFAIVVDDEPQGFFSLMRYDQANGVIEVGTVMYSDRLKQTTAATEAQYLLMKYVFHELNIRRYEWKCDDDNEGSKKAAVRLGFKFEGLFRQHLVYKNRNRDTAWFSIIDTEWPALKQRFEAWLDDSNFDGLKQIKKLEQF